jgi:hypothetical protein
MNHWKNPTGGPGAAPDPFGRGNVLDEEVCAENNSAIGIPEFAIPTETSLRFR